MSTKRWLVEGDDCAVLARAINSGVVTDDLKTFKDFFDPSSSGPGAEIGEKYGYSTQKGQRNLKTNWRKLLRKIQLWRSNHKDPDTGKPVRFSENFLKKGRFPARPDLLSDIAKENQPKDFVPGRDKIFEEVIQAERQEEEEEGSDNDSLTICSAGHSENEEESESEDEPADPPPSPPDPPQQQVRAATMPPSREPLRHKDQCNMSWEILHPIIAYVDVQDPSMRRRMGNLTRKGIIIRVDIPSGVVPASFVPEISADGTMAVFSCWLEQSRSDAAYTLGKHLLHRGEGVELGVQTALQQYWTHIKSRCTRTSEGGEVRDYRRYTLLLPEPCERELRDPCNDWEVNELGAHGSSVIIRDIRSTFYYFAMFTVKSKESAPALASVNTLLRMEEIVSDNPMNSTNLARTNYHNQQRVNSSGTSIRKSSGRKHRSRSRHPSRSRHHSKSRRRRGDRSRSRSRSPTIEESMASMDISDDSTIESTPEKRASARKSKRRGREKKKNSKEETESQYRSRVRGKQLKLLDEYQRELDNELRRLPIDEVKKKDKEIDEVIAQKKEEEQAKADLEAEERRIEEAYHNPPPLEEIYSPSSQNQSNVVDPEEDVGSVTKSRSGRASIVSSQTRPSRRTRASSRRHVDL